MDATRTYEVFYCKSRPDLCCAVPEHEPLPQAIDPETWEYLGKVVDDDSAPAGFSRGAAHYAVTLQGFYVFRWSRPPGRMALADVVTRLENQVSP